MRVENRGFTIHYNARGHGPGLLLIHGLFQSSLRWIECGYPDEFADSFRVVMPDLLGHGDSDKPHDPRHYSIDGLIDDLIAVLDAERLDAVNVWGYSAGAACAATLAAREPERTITLVVGGAPPNLPRDTRRQVYQPGIDTLRASDWQTFWDNFLPVPDEFRTRAEQSNDPIAVGAFLDGLTDTVPVFSHVEVPALCYHGTAEVFFDLAKATAQEHGAEFVPIEGLGHIDAFVQREKITPAVRDFLTRAMKTNGTTRRGKAVASKRQNS